MKQSQLEQPTSRPVEVAASLDEPRAAPPVGLEPEAEPTVEPEGLFRLLIDCVRDYAIFILDAQGHVATWNSGAERLNGYSAPEILGRYFSVFYPEDDVRAGKCELELKVALAEGRFEDEGWRLRKDGSRFWANVIITPLRDPAGRLLGFGKVTRDLTDRKREQEHLRAQDQRFGMLVESIRDYAVFILDPDGKVATWNSGAQRIKGYTAQEIVGSHFSRFYPPEEADSGKWERELEVAARVGRFEEEGWRVRKDGTRFWANVVLSAMRDELGELVGFSKVTRDLTDRKRAEEEVSARLAAEQANRTKDEFLAMLGHELRNPLAPIVSALQLLKLRGDPRNVREHQVIERQVGQMIRLVDDLLDVSRIAEGKIELKREHVELRELLARAAEMAIPLFEQKGQQFDVRVPPQGLMLDADPGRLIQVFTNLLNNAGKYTQAGGKIALTVTQLDGEVAIEVRDNGIGIEPSLLPRVFELFVQGYRGAARAEGGLGIGLTLVRSLVELHRGRVEAKSAGPGQGSTFTVVLPATGNPPAARTVPALDVFERRAGRRRRVLVVDDNEDACGLLAELLTALGHEVKTAADGPAALTLLQVFKPDVGVLDIGLPGMNGHELAAQIRALEGGAAIQLIALTGYGQPADRELSGAAGFDAHLVKPIDVQRLLDLIAQGAVAR